MICAALAFAADVVAFFFAICRAPYKSTIFVEYKRKQSTIIGGCLNSFLPNPYLVAAYVRHGCAILTIAIDRISDDDAKHQLDDSYLSR